MFDILHLMQSIYLLAILLIFATSLAAGAYPFVKKIYTTSAVDFPTGEAFATGVFLGASLIHILSEANNDFSTLGFHYPFAYLICAAVFLLLLLLEHISREMHEHEREHAAFAILAVVMLSIHSFLEGAALGLSGSISIMITLLIAILAHKWAASLALAISINKTRLSLNAGIILFLIFALMTPLGIITGDLISHQQNNFLLLKPIFTSMAAGTFLYLGTLHGLKQSVLIEKCCDLKHFSFVILGFSIMALVGLIH